MIVGENTSENMNEPHKLCRLVNVQKFLIKNIRKSIPGCIPLLLLPVLSFSVFDANGADAGRDPRPFITRQGDQLMEGAQPFRFFGLCASTLNMTKEQLLPDWSNRWPDEFEMRDNLDSLRRIGARATRVGIGLSIASENDVGAHVHVQAHRTYNEEGFVALDLMLALAREYDIRIIFPFVASQSFTNTRGVDEFAALSGKPKGSFWTDPEVREDFKHLVSFILNRRNTVNGVLYKEDPTILAWQLGNEFCSYAGDRGLKYEDWTDAIAEWCLDLAAFIKSEAPKHLVMEGGGVKRELLVADPNIDILSTHLYEYWSRVKGEPWEMAPMALEQRNALRGVKPLIVDELGLASYDNLRALLETIREEGIVGGLLWGMRGHRRDGGWYYHNEGGTPVNSYHIPGFAVGYDFEEKRTLDLLRKEAWAIRGLPVPAIEKPSGIPLLMLLEDGFTWRGCSGASAYRIERAASAEGSWTTVATGLHDSVIANVRAHESANISAPTVLWYDEYVNAGETWYYRILAYNEGGYTPWSPVLEVTHPTR
jgi:mannan endo-1,4-beta-mannosidase